MLIVQTQALLDVDHPSTLILPLTTNLIDDAEPLRIRVPAQSSLRRDSNALIDQLRAIDNRRLVEVVARLDESAMAQIAAALREVLDLE